MVKWQVPRLSDLLAAAITPTTAVIHPFVWVAQADDGSAWMLIAVLPDGRQPARQVWMSLTPRERQMMALIASANEVSISEVAVNVHSQQRDAKAERKIP